MTQQNNEFEKWFKNNYSNIETTSAYAKLPNKAWQAAKADSEREIAELRAENKQIDAINASLQSLREGINCPVCGSLAVTPKEVWYTNQINNLQAHINVLREALNAMRDTFDIGGDVTSVENNALHKADKALASTPAQSLTAERKEQWEARLMAECTDPNQ